MFYIDVTYACEMGGDVHSWNIEFLQECITNKHFTSFPCCLRFEKLCSVLMLCYRNGIIQSPADVGLLDHFIAVSLWRIIILMCKENKDDQAL